jgi:CcmD family protein
MTTAEKYVTAAYCVVFALVLVYVVIIALKLQRLEREVEELAAGATRRPSGRRSPLAELLFWRALLFYGEAALGYVGEARRPGVAGNGDDGACGSAGSPRPHCSSAGEHGRRSFPWGTWAGSLQPLRVARRHGISDLGAAGARTGCSVSS